MPFQPNDDPFTAPDFLAGLEAAGYLQRLDTSEERITARYQHALAKMSFAAHSEEFLTRAGVKKVHRSTVQFFSETPVADPYVHVMVGSLPPSRQSLVTPRGCETSGWTPIGAEDEADGTIHFTVSHPGFWPVTVVFDRNQSDLAREDKYASIRYNGESDEDLEDYLGGPVGGGRPPSRGGMGGSRRGSTYGGYGGDGAGRSGSRYGGSRSGGGAGYGRRSSYAADSDSGSGSSSDDDVAAGRGGGRYNGSGTGGGRRQASRSGTGMSASAMNAAMASMSMDGAGNGRSASRAASRAGSAYDRDGAGYGRDGAGYGRSSSRASRRSGY
ncbi:hypothetical protein JCM10207_002828 [Rhodosporidiobolus poonsookiae]